MDDEVMYRAGVWGKGFLWHYDFEDGVCQVWMVAMDEELQKAFGLLVQAWKGQEIGFDDFRNQVIEVIGETKNWTILMAVGDVVWLVGSELAVWLVRDGVAYLLSEGKSSHLSGWWKGDDELLVGQGVSDELFLDEDWRRNLVSQEALGGAVILKQRLGIETSVVASVGAGNLEKAKEHVPVTEPVMQDIDAKDGEPSGYKRWLWQVGDTLVRWLPAEDQVYVMQDQVEQSGEKGRKYMVIMAGLLLLVLGGSLVWGLQSREERVLQRQFGTLVTDVEHKLQESVSLADLNPLRSEALLQEVDQLLQEMEARGLPTEQLQALRQQMQSTTEVVRDEHQIEPTTWQRLTLIRDNAEAMDGYLGGGMMAVADFVGGRVINLEIESKAPEVLGNENLIGKPMQVAQIGEVVYVYSDMGLLALDGEEVTLLSEGRNLERVLDIGVFGTSVYVMDDQGIWKVSQSEGELVWDQWLDEEATSMWTGGAGMAIDGMIWVAKGQTIEKFVRGAKDVFSIQGLARPFAGITGVYTDETAENLYVLDGGLQRVVVLDKETGTFVQEYSWTGLGAVSNVFVDEEKGMMWWMGKQEIWEVRIQ